MILYLLDTHIVSHFVKGIDPMLTARMTDAMREQEVAISVITHAEVRFGQGLMPAQDKRLRRISALLEQLPTRPWTVDAADRYGEVKSKLRLKGISIGEMDTRIAAHALVENLTLVTHNTRHFERIAGLKLEDWTSLSKT